jgi:hypothetical protein
MSNSPTLTKNYSAGGAVTKRRIVKWSADATVVQATAATEKLIGVAGELSAASGARIDIHRAGIVEVEYGGEVTRGDPLTSDADGKAVAATRHTHTENTAGTYAQNATTAAAANVGIIGYAEISGVSGDIGLALLVPSLA